MMSCAKHGHEHAGNQLLLLFVVGKQSEYFGSRDHDPKSNLKQELVLDRDRNTVPVVSCHICHVEFVTQRLNSGIRFSITKLNTFTCSREIKSH